MAAPLKTVKLLAVTLMSCLQGAGPSRCYSSFSSNTFYLVLFMILCFCLSLIDV